MASTHPDYIDLDASAMSDAEMLAYVQANIVPATRTLNGEFLELDSTRGLARCRFKIVPAFCHSQGTVCQGGFLTGMVDIAMANAALVKDRFTCAVPTLELKISFFEPVGLGSRNRRGSRAALGRFGRLPRRRHPRCARPARGPCDMHGEDRSAQVPLAVWISDWYGKSITSSDFK